MIDPIITIKDINKKVNPLEVDFFIQNALETV